MTGHNPLPRKVQTTKLRVLAVHRYYWPDTPPYASLLRRIVQRWHEDGHEVEVLSSQPSYKANLENEAQNKSQTIDGVRVRRLNLSNEAGKPLRRIINATRLGLSLFWRSIGHRYDVIMISTAPPVLGGIAAAIAAKLTGARFIYHCMDIHPEVGRVSGEFANPGVFKLLQKMDNWSCRQAKPVVVLSHDMKQTLQERSGGKEHDITVLNNFSLPEHENPADTPAINLGSSQLNIIFAGNIGRFQGLDAIVQAMTLLKGRDDIHLTLMGDGVAKESLQRQVQKDGANVEFVGHQPLAVAKATMRKADLGFVSLVPGMYKYAYPSKTMTYLEQGCPLIVAVEPESELAQDVSGQGYGFTVPPDDAQALASLFIRLVEDSHWKEPMRENATRKAMSEFSEQKVLNRWSKLIASQNMEQ